MISSAISCSCSTLTAPTATRRRPRERPSLLRGLQLPDPRLHPPRPQPQLAGKARQPRLTPPQLLDPCPPLFPQLLVLRPLLVRLPFSLLQRSLGVSVQLYASTTVAEYPRHRAAEDRVLAYSAIQEVVQYERDTAQVLSFVCSPDSLLVPGLRVLRSLLLFPKVFT